MNYYLYLEFILKMIKHANFKNYDIFSLNLSDILKNFNNKQKSVLLSVSLSFSVVNFCSKLQSDNDNVLIALFNFIIDNSLIESFDIKIDDDQFDEFIDKFSNLIEDLSVIDMIFYLIRYMNDKRIELNSDYFYNSLLDFVSRYDVFDYTYIHKSLKSLFSYDA